MALKDEATIEVMENGPLIVRGLHRVRTKDGEAVSEKNVMALCRCGKSADKPFCDGSHSKSGFSGKRISEKPMDREKAYRGKDVIVHDNRVICAHAGHCVRELASVFTLKSRPWVNPDGDTVDSVVELVKRCPSGALSYSIDDVQHRNFESAPSVEAEKGGPYRVTGDVHLKHELQPPSVRRFTLCRCGESQNKPFCDGSHHKVKFD